MSTVAALPEIRVATFDDYERIVALEAANGLDSLAGDDWRNLWVTNPLWPRLGVDWPIGWVLEDSSGRLVGSLINIPSRYTFRGAELICANGRGWVVDADYRGFALALMGEYTNQPEVDLFVNTTVGPTAVAAISSFNDRIPTGDFETVAYFATRYHALAKKKLKRLGLPGADWLAYPAAVALRCKDAWRNRALRSTPVDVEVESIDQFDNRFDGFWAELVRQNPDKLLACRDRAALAWHFAIPQRRGDLWIFTASRGGLLRGYCVVKRHDPQGEFRRMRLIDYHSIDTDGDLLPALLGAVLRRCAVEGVQVLEHLGCGLPKMASFDRFSPYRRQLACWPFYYRANNDPLEVALAEPAVWDPSTYDGDSSYV